MKNISFHQEDVNFKLTQINLTRKWITDVSHGFNKEIGMVSYIFCSDNYLLAINNSYLNHNNYTDIITFPYTDDPIESDIFISIDRIRDNANHFNVSFETELRRVMAHGILHLCGFSDKTEKQKEEMKEQEDRALQLWEKLLNEKKTK